MVQAAEKQPAPTAAVLVAAVHPAEMLLMEANPLTAALLPAKTMVMFTVKGVQPAVRKLPAARIQVLSTMQCLPVSQEIRDDYRYLSLWGSKHSSQL